MAISWTVKTSVAVPGLSSNTDQSVTLTGDTEMAFSLDVGPGITSSLTFGTIDHLKVIAVLFNSIGEGLVINTNAVDATGGNGFTLTASKAIEWDNTQTVANILTHDVSALWFINSGTKTATARVGFLLSL